MKSKIDLILIEVFLVIQGVYILSLLLKFLNLFFPEPYMYILGIVLLVTGFGPLFTSWGLYKNKSWAIVFYWICIITSLLPKLMGSQNIYIFSSAWLLLILNMLAGLYLTFKYWKLWKLK